MIALEEIGLPFEVRLVRFMNGEHKTAEFKALNSKGKVPTLVIDGVSLTENVAIITYLNERFPAAALMPPADDALARARQIADLCFCATTLHPFVPRICLPHIFAQPDAMRSVHDRAVQGIMPHIQLIEDRLATGPWWYGDQWSAMDGYLFWVFWRTQSGGFDPSPFPRFCDHAERIQTRPAVQRTMAREEAQLALLASEGHAFPQPPFAPVA